MHRAIVTLALGGVVLAAAPSSAHDGHGVLPVSIKGFAFGPQTIEAFQRDTVLWTWDGDDRNHSVTAKPGSPLQFDSDPGRMPDSTTHPAGDQFAVTFPDVGTYEYVCKVHSGMAGKIVVKRDPGTADVTAPKITRARVSRGILRFTLDEAGDVVVRLVRGGRTVRRAEPRGKAGANAVRLRLRGLKAGRYAVRIAATDADGNTSRTVSTSLTVRR